MLRSSSTEVTARAHSYSDQLTTHHLIKWIALLLMTIDHVGAYLAPDLLWLRAIGRLSAPLWFFLLGHAPYYRSRANIFLWAGAMAAISPWLGAPVFALNVLVTIVAGQGLLRLNERYRFIERQPLVVLLACAVFLPTSPLFMEYGSSGILYMFLGYAVKEGLLEKTGGKLLLAGAWLFYGPVQSMALDYGPAQVLFILVATAVQAWLLTRFTFRPVRLPGALHAAQPALLWMARHSLPYYAIHRLLLQAAGVAFGVLEPGFRWMD